MAIFFDAVEGFDSAHTWVLAVPSGRPVTTRYYLTRMSITTARKALDVLEENPHNLHARSVFAFMLRSGVGVVRDLKKASWLEGTSVVSLRSEDVLKEMRESIAKARESIAWCERMLNPFPYLPCADWVECGIGADIWPFFRKEYDNPTPVNVPVHAASCVLIYRQDKYGGDSYTLRDSYMLSRKTGVGIPTLFIHNTARGKEDVAFPRNIKVKTQNRSYIALYGVLYFTGVDDARKQRQMLRTCFAIDVDNYVDYVRITKGVYPEFDKLLESVNVKRERARQAESYLARGKDKAKLQRAKHVCEEYAALTSELRKIERTVQKDSPLNLLRFHALDILEPTNFKPNMREWIPLTSKSGLPFTNAAQKIIKPSLDLTDTVSYSTHDGRRYWL